MPKIGDTGVYRGEDSSTTARIRSVTLGVAAGLHVLVPFPREERLLLRVAVLAGRHRVRARGPPAADQRHDVIHGERLRAHLPPTVVTRARRDAPLPPGAPAQLA